MKKIVSTLVFTGLVLLNSACPDKNNNASAPGQIIGTPTTQCLTNIPTGINGQSGNYPVGTGYPGGYPYNASCVGYGTSNYFSPYNYNAYGYNFNNGFYCGNSYSVAVYSNYYGLGCVPVSAIPYNVLYYSYSGGSFGAYGYLNFGTNGWYGAWNQNNVAISCVTSYPGCNCISVGGTSGGVGICTR